ncbi:MAG TPA: hypothetical protein VL993_00855 [Stellaceae bacterium]|nr:hypothetical protein [Stellaceae bacterium]
MSVKTSLKTTRGLRRLTPILAIGALAALLSGCVVYPAGGYYGPPPHGYWHGGYYYR